MRRAVRQVPLDDQPRDPVIAIRLKLSGCVDYMPVVVLFDHVVTAIVCIGAVFIAVTAGNASGYSEVAFNEMLYRRDLETGRSLWPAVLHHG